MEDSDFPNDLLALRPFKVIYRIRGYPIADGLENNNEIHPDFKRLFYPLEYHYDFQPPTNVCGRVLQSLNDLCVDKIVEHDNLLVKLCPYLPSTFYYNLMGIAEYYEETSNSRVLMFNWPFRTFTAMDVISYHTERSMGPMEDISNLGYCFVNFMRYFFESLQKNRTKHLRILDMRGIPIDDEFMGKFVRDIFYLSRDPRVPFGYHIILDCAIGKSPDTIKELTSLIRKQRKSSKKRIHLHINKLDVHYTGSYGVNELLKHIDRKELVGLSIDVGFGDHTWPVLKRFTKLVALKITGKICPLHHYPNLRRLSLESRNFSDALLDPVTEKLEFLELRNSDVMEEADLRHLSSLRFTNLRELNISGQQIVVDNLEMWCGFLRSLTPTLQILQVENCVEDEDLLIVFLLDALLMLVNLRYLNMSRNTITLDTMIEDVRKFISLPKLECIELPDYFEDEHFKENFPSDSNGLSGRDRFEFEFKNKSCPTLILWCEW